MYSPNFSVENKSVEVTKFKAKGSEIKAIPLSLGSISTSFNLSSSDIEDSKLHGNI